MSSHLSHLSQFDHTKINAQVIREANLVIETHLVSDLVSGQRRVPKQKVWRVERIIGKGAFGEIRLEVLMEGSEQRAVKRLWTSGSTLKREYQRELEALVEFSKLKYKEAAVFVEFLGWFEDSDSVYLAMEYIPLGDLEHNVPSSPGQLVESEIRLITFQILEGLKIMHSESFVHRDLKPKNVLVCRTGPQWWVKLADFGLTKRRTEETAYRTQTGTESYMAPEILDYVPREDPHKSAYTTAVDLWALGCIVYRLGSGVVPFPPGPSLYKFCENPSGFLYQSLQLDQSGIEFIRSLLAPIPRDRLNAQQALDHPWMQIGFNLNSTSGLVPFSDYGQRTTWESTLNTEGYDTVTHAGLQSRSATQSINSHDSPSSLRPIPLHTTKEISQPSLAAGIVTSNHLDRTNIDESLDNSAQRIVADLAPPLYADGYVQSNKSTSKTFTRTMPAKEGQVDEHISSPKFAESIEKVWKESERFLQENPPRQTWANVAATGLTPSQMSERPNSNLGQPQAHSIPASVIRQTPQAKGVASHSPFQRTTRRSAAIIIKNPDGDIVKLPSAKPLGNTGHGLNRPDIYHSATSTHALEAPVNTVSGGLIVKPSALTAPTVAQVTSHGKSNSYGATEKSNASIEDAPLSKSAKRKAKKAKQLYENSTAELPAVEVNPFTVLGPVSDLPTKDKPERNENPLGTADTGTRAKASLTAFENFKLHIKQEAAATRLEKARKDREAKLDDLRAFSKSFNLHAPIPADLLPILTKDPAKQRHIQAKALKDTKPLLASYEPSLEDAKRSVG
ncbi:hypothetical protein V501_06415 [Pseudogymnoascus sp. VKM F-4519 (FW-2642)]|nr:hypothetical protein V501_06415 [Pseudogymnoascus sp. VKM F-4519 (FW-2642)]